MKDRFNQIQEINMKVIDVLSLYEKDILYEYAGKKDDRFIFYDNSIQNIQENKINPYNQLYDSITED